MLQAYIVEGRSLKPVSGHPAGLSAVYWIDICEPTPDEQKAVEQALGTWLRLPEEPAKFQISTPVRSSDGAITLTALLLAGFDPRRRTTSRRPSGRVLRPARYHRRSL